MSHSHTKFGAGTMIKRGTLLTAIAVTALTVAGCRPSIGGTPVAGEADIRQFDVGKYSTEPLDSYYEYSHSLRSGTSLAAIRLANHVATGLDIEQKLRYGTGVQEIVKPADVKSVLSEAGVPIAERNNVMFGFASGSSDTKPEPQQSVPPNSTLTTIAVMQFPDSDAARLAAAEFEQADFSMASDLNQSVQLPKYPLAHSHWRPGIPSIGSTIAHGSYVVTTFVSTSKPSLPDLTDLTEKVYAAQLPMLDSLPPLSAEDVLRLDNDPDGVIRQVINPMKLGVPSMGSLATYELQGFLHWQTDRSDAKQLYSEVHAERFAFSGAYSSWTTSYGQGVAQAFGKGITPLLEGAILTRTRDAESAGTLWSKVLDAEDANAAPPNVPDTKCAEVPSTGALKNITCAVRYHQFVGLVWGTQLLDAQQRAAAQYAILANSQ